MAKYTFYASTGFVGCTNEETQEIPDEELEGMTEEEKSEYIYEVYMQDWVANNLDLGFYKEGSNE